MKKTILFIGLATISTLILKPTAFAVTRSATISATPSSKQSVSTESAEFEKIQKIKEVVAKKVAELKLVEKKGILGVVKEVANTQIIVEDKDSNRRTIDIDELTKFQAHSQDGQGSSKSFGISDIKQDDLVSSIGLYNKETKRLLARVVSKVTSIPFYFEGLVRKKDVKEFTLAVVDGKGNEKSINIENSTKTQSWSQDEKEGVRSGFSKIKVGQRILIVGFADLKEKNVINASRVLHFKDIPPSDEMKRFLNVGSEEVSPSTGSGKKLTPSR